MLFHPAIAALPTRRKLVSLELGGRESIRRVGKMPQTTKKYAKVSFQNGGRCRFDDGETGTWTLKGTKLNISTSSDAGVQWVAARDSGITATGTAVLGMNSQVPYWVRLREIR